jgi:hypothetical protein
MTMTSTWQRWIWVVFRNDLPIAAYFSAVAAENALARLRRADTSGNVFSSHKVRIKL